MANELAGFNLLAGGDFGEFEVKLEYIAKGGKLKGFPKGIALGTERERERETLNDTPLKLLTLD